MAFCLPSCLDNSAAASYEGISNCLSGVSSGLLAYRDKRGKRLDAIVYCLPGSENPVQGGRRNIITATVMGNLAEFQAGRNGYPSCFCIVCGRMKPTHTDISSK